jgi:hypothetical protein
MVSPVAFAQRAIDVVLSLGTGPDGTGKPDVLTLTGLRVSAAITITGGDSMGLASVRIWGLPLALMTRCSAISSYAMQLRKNSMAVYAGNTDPSIPKRLVFQGQIISGWTDIQNAPEASLNLEALSGAWESIQPASATSYAGSVDAATIMQNLATRMGLAFENGGVNGVILSTPAFHGGLWEQAAACARAAHIGWTVDRGTLAIWPLTGHRNGDPVEISSATGMIAYPAYNGTGMDVRSLFNPDLKMGGLVTVKSSLAVLSGTFTVTSLVHNIESEMPGGQWATRVTGIPKIS